VCALCTAFWVPSRCHLAEGGGEGGDDVGLLVAGEFGEDGDGEAFVGCGFGVGEIAFFVSEVAEALLQVEREWIIDFGTDAMFCEDGADFIPMGDADDELVVDVVVGETRSEPRLDG
jgi:hypothetical protein